MEIVLSQKDADSILKYLREQLESTTEAYNQCDKLISEVEKTRSSLTKDAPAGLKQMLDGLLDKKIENARKNTLDGYNTERKQLLKFIELLTIGSENETK